jgi:hypothetical protein
MVEEFKNRRKGMVLFKMWLTPEEVDFLLNSTDGKHINTLLNLVAARGDII